MRDDSVETLAARFWSKVDRRGPDECWPWTAGGNQFGRGMIRYRGKKPMATHVSLMLSGRPLRPGEWALHHCDNPSCVNPTHLFAGNQYDNMRDMVEKGRHHLHQRQHCRAGHPLSGDNLGSDGEGYRLCRTCSRIGGRERARRRRERRRLAAALQLVDSGAASNSRGR